jgi:hypothetical protein
MNQVLEVARVESPSESERRARSLRAEVLVRTVGAPWRWLRTHVERLRAPIDFEPVEF